MIYIGIDPGRKGGFAIIDTVHDTVQAQLWDDMEFVRKMVEYSECGMGMIACVEKVNAMPGQGVTSMFSFGKSAGFIEGVLTALGLPFQLVSPRVWKKDFGLDSSKQKSIEVCGKLFPSVNLLATERSRVPSDGIAESLLLAKYAQRHF